MFKAEREFVKTSRAHLDVLRGALPLLQWQIIIGACDILTQSAQSVRARGIALAARQCGAAANAENETLCAHMLTALVTLTDQYAAGLAEIDTREATAIYAEHTPQSAGHPHPASPLPDTSGAARERLANVIHLATETERPALQKLIAVSRAANDAAMPAPRADIAMQPFEALMLPVTNAALSSAHHHGLRVSLSYEGHDSELSQALAPALETALCTLTRYRIETALRRNPARLHHMSLTAQQSASGLTVRYADGGAAEQSARLDELPDIVALDAIGGWLANDGDAIILHCPLRPASAMPAGPQAHDAPQEPSLADTMMEALA
ncbi:hypothetical protein [Robiginitomaculum antarcticum]|uniref:hypothetical protein n=1 Tax=Robiginitomaculum antarcticum TaxID=437507 RepID=UPI0003740388|nr:hypothetical protein [Robiginitomaculum antarcticum]